MTVSESEPAVHTGSQPWWSLKGAVRFAPIFTILALTLCSILLHTKWCGTPILSSEARWREIVDYHLTFYPFSIRYFTTYLVLGINALTGLPLRETFVTVQYLLMATVAFLLYRFLLMLKLSRGMAHFGMFLFLISFPIIFAHSEPVFTWDDGWTYLFLLLTVMALMNGRLWPAVIYFTLGCFAREQMLLYWPVFLFGIYSYCGEEPNRHRLLAAVIPLLLYGAFYAAMFEAPEQQRFELLQYNFETLPRAANSLFSIFISFGAIWVAWLFALGRFLRIEAVDAAKQQTRFLAWASLLAMAPTLFIGMLFALARETRIFFPPFVFIIPLALLWMQARIGSAREQWRNLRFRLTILTIVAVAGGILLLRSIKPDLDYRNCPDFCYLWSGIHMGLTVGVILLAIRTGRVRQLSSKPKATAL